MTAKGGKRSITRKSGAKPKPKPKPKPRAAGKTRPKPSVAKKAKPAARQNAGRASSHAAPQKPNARVAEPKLAAPALHARFDLDAARATWFVRQGLSAPMQDALPRVVARTGWLRTLGGADVYIAARARRPSLTRAELDSSVSSHALRVLPAARSCMYLVPQEHAAIALGFADGLWRRRTDRELHRAGSSWKEVHEIGREIAALLGKGPLSTDAVRRGLPPGTVRSLGDAGKKLGLASPLPVALRDLELKGVIERTLDQGRLDSERYVWRSATSTPIDASHRVRSDVELTDEIVAIFFSQMGPATMMDFSEWAGISRRHAAEAIARVGLIPIAVDGYADVAYIDEAGLPLLSQPATFGDRVSFLSFEDNYIIHHGGPASFCDARHHEIEVASWGSSRPMPLGQAKHLSTRTFLLGDRIAGFWEFDAEAQEIVTHLFDGHPRDVIDHVDSCATSFARFLFEDIGHGRSFSLDTDDSVRERAHALRQLRARAHA